MLRLGHHCLNGLGAPQDGAAALTWYKRAIEGGYSYANMDVALVYLNGWGVQADAVLAAEYLAKMAEHGQTYARYLSRLYLLGYGNLAPDAEQALYWFDQAEASARRFNTPEGAAALEAAYEERRATFLASGELHTALFIRPSPIMWSDGVVRATDAMDMGDFWCDGDGGVVDYAEAARWYEMAIEMDTDSTGFAYQSSHYALGNFYRDGSLGVIDADQAIRHYGHAASYDRIAAMFRDGVTGPDGTVYLAPDATLADAFAAVDEYREGTHAHYILIGDLFRTGKGPDRTALVTPDPYLAAAFYFRGDNNPYCAAQLTEMYKGGLITDPMLLYRLARDIPYSECDVSELILLLADDLINRRVTTWLSSNATRVGYTCVDLGADLLEDALRMDKLPDPQAADALLALVPEDE